MHGFIMLVETMPERNSLTELAAVFLRLGCLSFGGPVAHLGYFHDEFVKRRKWLDDGHYTDLVALCNFLPGPASSQVVFAIGMQRAGLAGAMVASLAFLLPSALIMVAFGYGLASMSGSQSTGWLHGLKIAAAAVVAQAVWNMAKRLCPDIARALLGFAAAALVFFLPGPYTQVIAIAAGMAFGGLLLKKIASKPNGTNNHSSKDENAPADAIQQLETPSSSHAWAAAALVLYGALLVILPLIASGHAVRVFASFYRAGALVFGGGHVVLPLLRAEVVPPGWVSDGTFLAGYGAAQALPGPLFSFAAYLGVEIFGGPHAWIGGLLCLFGIYLPAWLVIGGALPFWHTLRKQPWAQGALGGANAAVVGILLAALVNPIGTEAIGNWRDLVAAVVAFSLLEKWRVPPWAIVIAVVLFGGLL